MPHEILPDIYDITIREADGRRNRVYLVLDDVPTLIDAGFEDTTETLFDAIDEIGTEPERLIITHGDPDHIDGFDATVERYGLETWVPEQTDMSDFEDPDHRYGDGDTIGEFETIYTPGHRHDHHSLVDEERQLLVAGDAVFGADLRGLAKGRLIPPPALYSENVNLAEKSMEQLLEYDFDAALVFHGSSATENAHEKLDAFVNFPGKPGWATYE